MRLALLLPLVALCGAVPVIAADTPPQQTGWRRPSPEQMEAHRAAMEAARSSDVALLLGLRADQKPALDGFLATLRPQHGMQDGQGRGRGSDKADRTPQDEGTIAALDHMSQRIDRRDAEAKQRIEATRRFYAGLTADQQKRFDAMAHLMHSHFGHGGMHDHGGDRSPHPMG
jgi:hypothetical protein